MSDRQINRDIDHPSHPSHPRWFLPDLSRHPTSTHPDDQPNPKTCVLILRLLKHYPKLSLSMMSPHVRPLDHRWGKSLIHLVSLDLVRRMDETFNGRKIKVFRLTYEGARVLFEIEQGAATSNADQVPA